MIPRAEPFLYDSPAGSRNIAWRCCGCHTRLAEAFLGPRPASKLAIVVVGGLVRLEDDRDDDGVAVPAGSGMPTFGLDQRRLTGRAAIPRHYAGPKGAVLPIAAYCPMRGCGRLQVLLATVDATR